MFPNQKGCVGKDHVNHEDAFHVFARARMLFAEGFCDLLCVVARCSFLFIARAFVTMSALVSAPAVFCSGKRFIVLLKNVWANERKLYQTDIFYA